MSGRGAGCLPAHQALSAATRARRGSPFAPQCPLKPESEPALAALAASSHMLVMITGDAPLTACHAAAQVHIVQRPALVLQHRCGPLS